jgi:hypothetical protein
VPLVEHEGSFGAMFGKTDGVLKSFIAPQALRRQ